MKLVITANGLQRPEMKPVIDLAKSYFDEVVENPWGRRGTQDEIRRIWNGADAIICGAEAFDKAFIEEAPKSLKVLSHYGVGVDSIDIPAVKARGIMVCNTPGANADSVADMALCLILATARQVVNHDTHTRLGEWKRYPSFELKGKRLGIAGFGAIGQGVARRAAGFDMEIWACDPCFSGANPEIPGVKKATLDEIITSCDIISLHMPSTQETRHIIDARALGRMKKSAVLINTARGDLIDEEALYAALTSGQIAAAGLDVYAHEPIKESPLFSLHNVTLMPHCSANTTEAARNMGFMAVENARRALSGMKNAHIL